MPNNNLMQPQPPGVRNGNESTGLCDSRGSAGASRQVSGKVGKVCEAGCREVQRGWKDLVHSVEGGVARVELDGGEGRLTGGGSGISHGGSDGGDSVAQGSSDSGSSSISSGIVEVRESVVSQGSRVRLVASVASVVEGRKTSVGLGKDVLGGSLHDSGLGSVVSLEECSLGLNNGGSIHDWLGNVDGGNSEVGGGDRKVVRVDTESEVISHVVDSVDTGLVSVGVGPGDSSVSVASFLLGAVDVGVTEGEVLVLVLSLVLRAVRGSNRSSLSNDWGGDGLSNHWGGHSLGIGGNDWGAGGSVPIVITKPIGGQSFHWGSNHWGGGGSIQSGDLLGSVGKVCWSREGCSVGESWDGSVGRVTSVEAGLTEELRSDGKLSLSGHSSQQSGDYSKELHC